MPLPRHAEIWFPDYAAVRLRSWLRPAAPARRVWFTIADHFEPFWRTLDEDVARRRVALWRRQRPEIARRHADSADKVAAVWILLSGGRVPARADGITG